MSLLPFMPNEAVQNVGRDAVPTTLGSQKRSKSLNSSIDAEGQ